MSAGIIYTEYNIQRPMLKYALKTSTREMSKLFEIMMASVFQYGCENWTLLKQQERRTERAEMEVLMSTAGYTLYYHKTNGEIREVINTRIIRCKDTTLTKKE